MLQFLDAFFINAVCWIGDRGANGLEALVLLLFNRIGTCFSGTWLRKMGQHVVVVVDDVGISEASIPSDL